MNSTIVMRCVEEQRIPVTGKTLILKTEFEPRMSRDYEYLMKWESFTQQLDACLQQNFCKVFYP